VFVSYFSIVILFGDVVASFEVSYNFFVSWLAVYDIGEFADLFLSVLHFFGGMKESGKWII